MTRDTPTTSSRRLVSALVAMLAAIAVWSMVPAAAQAAFPGTNGNIAFGSARNGFPADNDLYTMANNGTAQTRITSLNLDELNPAWSPNGLKIAYERTNGLRSDIWVANADGTNQVQLTNHARNDTRPSWSNTGKKIVFASDRNSAAGTSDLFVMDSNGANQIAITNTPTINEDYPSYSPDGSAIAFSRNGDIYKASPNGTNLTRLTTATSDDIEPDWSPIANQIVYRTGQPFDEIWKMNADGTGKVDISNTGSEVEERPAVVPAGRQDRVHPRCVQGRRGLHDEPRRDRSDAHHDQHVHGRQHRMAAEPPAGSVRPSQGSEPASRFPGTELPGLQDPEPRAQPAAQRWVVQPAEARLALPDGRHARRQRAAPRLERVREDRRRARRYGDHRRTRRTSACRSRSPTCETSRTSPTTRARCA